MHEKNHERNSMKNSNRCLLIALALVLFAGSAWARPESREDYQQMYLRYVKLIDANAKIDSDGDVQFKHGDRTYFIQVNESDRQFFRLVLPNFWSIDDPVERLEVCRAADAANSSTKVCKIHTVGDDTWASVELLLAEPEDFADVFNRSLQVIGTAVDTFLEDIRSR
jgi:hypothetical protein